MNGGVFECGIQRAGTYFINSGYNLFSQPIYFWSSRSNRRKCKLISIRLSSMILRKFHCVLIINDSAALSNERENNRLVSLRCALNYMTYFLPFIFYSFQATNKFGHCVDTTIATRRLNTVSMGTGYGESIGGPYCMAGT